MSKSSEKNPLTGLEIAVVGMSGRFPGARTIDEFWENLKNGKETITFFSNKELEESGVDPQLLKRANYVKAKGYIEDIEYFDASFFDYTPREARLMDPQVRLLHECTWEALENAGYDPEAFTGLIGFYAGASFNAGWLSHCRVEFDTQSRLEAGSLCYKDSLSTLIAYKLNLKGPAFTLYSACSTALVAIHQACRGLLTGECQIALAGTASVSIPKKNGYLFEPGMILSPDGHCRVFDAEAGGTVFSDGAGAVVLKRLEDALHDSDFIYAVIKASAINNDGRRKAGYAAPSVEGQEEVIRGALLLAEVDPESISYIEAHGTGTSVGDSIEMEALARVFNTGKMRYCAVGSVKSNLGHLDVASGMAGFIKTVLALTHREIPPTLNFNVPNPEIDFQNSAFFVNTRLTPWENGEHPLRAGINASGIGGTNVHIILEEAPISVSSEISRGCHLLTLSTRTGDSLETAAVNLTYYLKKHSHLNLADAAYTLHVGRRAFPQRMAVVCRNIPDALEILERRDSRFLFTGQHIDRSVIFMFPGHGAQYPYMAYELYRGEPVFKEHLDRCAEIVKSLSGIDLIDVLFPRTDYELPGIIESGEPLNNTRIAQPALFALEYSLARMWMEWGVKPGGMIGHSVGEYAAACLSGVFTIEDALTVVIERGRLIQETPEGRMLSIGLDENKIQPFLGREVWLAAVNSPNQCIVSGTPPALRRLEKRLVDRHISCIPLKTGRAFHSGLMDDILDGFTSVMKKIRLSTPQIPFVSCSEGRWITPGEAVDPLYWVNQLRRTVHFSSGLQELLREPNRVFLEVGPGDTLKRLAEYHIPWGDPWGIFASLRRSDEVESDRAFLLKTLARLWVCGVSPDWQRFYRLENRRRIPMPTYPFERERYWFDTGKQPVKTKNIVEGKQEIPALNFFPRPGLSVSYKAPSGKIEGILVAAWEEIFGIQPIGVNDNFFELGGHSLNASIVTARVHRELDVKLSLKDIFDYPTIGQLAAYLEAASRESYSTVKPVEKREYYDLSSAQKRLFFLWQMEREGIGYNMPVVWIVQGTLDLERCEDVFRRLIRRHESLRTSFHIVEGIPVQRVHEIVDFTLERCAFGGGGDVETVIRNFIKPFDLSFPPLLRVALVNLTSKRHLFLFDMHHIVSDGISMNIFAREYITLYGEESFPPLSIHYKDFAHWQEVRKESEILKKQEAYWIREFEGEVPVLNLPVDFPRDRTFARGTVGGSMDFEIDRVETRALNKLATAEGATLFIMLLSIFYVLLARLSGQEDIIVGVPSAGRGHADVQNVIGMFVNTLAIRNFPAAGKVFSQFLGEVRERVFEDFDNQDFQFEDLVEKVGVTFDRSRNPLFDVMFVLQNIGTPEIEIPGLRFKPYPFEHRVSRFDLSLNAAETDGLLHCRMRYGCRLFRKETSRRFIKYFKKIAAAIIANPGIMIADIEMITEEEKRLILEQFNRSAAPFPREKTLYQLFRDRVSKNPDHIAIKGPTGSIDPISPIAPIGPIGPIGPILNLSYTALHVISSRLARIVRQKGVVPGTVAAVMADRSIETVTGIIAVLASGGAYLPIDPAYPRERVHYMLADSSARVLLTARSYSQTVTFPIERVYHDPIPPGFPTEPDGACPGDPAYIIYTSGTTGKPRGVVIEHRSAVNVVTWFGERYRLGPGVHVLQMSNYTFDASVNQVFGSLLYGAVLHVVSKNLIPDIDAIREYIDTYRINLINFVPIVLNQLLGSGPKLKSLRIVISGAESLDDTVKDRILEKDYELHNHYGPTEAAVDALASRCSACKVDLGTPISNSRCYILDKDRNIVPVGVAGELYIGGAGVGRGYLNNPQLTAEKFIRLPHIKGERLYYSGDLVRWLPDGNVEFLGRVDHQVKIRGYRIELGEIQNQLLTDPLIKEAVVLARGSGEKYLCAYIVSDEAVDLNRVKERLSRRLPAYMVPARYVRLEKIPLTAAGKLDRKSLPEPEERFDTQYIPPGDAVEEKLVEIWAEVLGRPKEIIGRDTNFFELGGHSLKATLLVSKIHKAFDVRVPLEKVFMTPFISELAISIRTGFEDIYTAVEIAEKRNYYALSSAQKRLYVLQQMDEAGVAYNMLTVMVLEGTLDREKMEQVFTTLIHRHESLRTSFTLLEGSSVPVQVIHENVDFRLRYDDLEGRYSATSREDSEVVRSFLEIETIIRDFVRPFDLSHAPLLRVGLIRVEMDRYILIVDMHHIISDGVSVNRFVTEFITLYQGLPLPVLKLQYKDYAGWQAGMRQLDEGKARKQENYWKTQFAGDIPYLDLPVDFPRENLHSFAGGQKHFRLTRGQTRALKQFALDEGVSLYMILLAVSTIFLARIGNREDIIIGTPTAGRPHSDLQNIIGVFVNTLALRNFPSGEKTVKIFLEEVKARTLAAFENQDYYFEDLVDRLAIVRDVSRSPLFDVMFALQNFEIPKIRLPELKLTPYPFDRGISLFDLSIIAEEREEQLRFVFEYSAKLFKQETIHRFSVYFKHLLICIPFDRDKRISQLELMTPAEKVQVLHQFNDTDSPFPETLTIHRMFEGQAERIPDRVALVGPGVHRSDRSFTAVTYRELNEQSGRAVFLLVQKGIKVGDIIGVTAERSVRAAVLILGILKAGAVYMPIDPGYPKERIAFMLADSNAKLAVSVDLLEKGGKTVVSSLIPASALAYIIYTSGSTGVPRGVAVEHRSLVNRLYWLHREYRLDQRDVVLQKTSFIFDVSVCETFRWIPGGGRLAVLPPGREKDPDGLIGFIERCGVTVIEFVPSLLNAFLDYIASSTAARRVSALRIVFAGGEAVDTNLVNTFNRVLYNPNRTRLINAYGPTEAAVDVTHYMCPVDKPLHCVPIGTPIANTRIYILDKYRTPQPVGVVGELHIAGAALARGYLNNPDLTAQRFNLSYPSNRSYRSHRSNRSYFLYATGDLARWLPDGSIQFIGRKDTQVKIRGIRIELGEIESRLLKHHLVKEAVVLAREDTGGGKCLCAYVVPASTGPSVSSAVPEISELKTYLSLYLPSYMVPLRFVLLEQIPLTPTGKIDRRALIESEVPGARADQSGSVTEEEALLAGVWAEVLHVHAPGIDRNFFELGGDSIKAIQVAARLRNRGYSLKLSDLFLNPTIRQLAPYLRRPDPVTGGVPDTGEIQGEVPLTPIQEWFFRSRFYPFGHYNQYVLLYRQEGFAPAVVERVFKEIAAHHDALRIVFTGKGTPGSPVVQFNKGTDRFHIPVLMCDISTGEDPAEAVRETGGKIQQSIDLSGGPLVKPVIFRAATGDYLLIVIHHLVVDGVSWRILLEDFAHGYVRADAGRDIRFPAKTDSFKEWAMQLHRYAGGTEILRELEYWKSVESTKTDSLPRFSVPGAGRFHRTLELDEGETRLLLEDVHRAYGTGINDILLAALAAALNRWAGMETILVNLEGHGREPIIEGIDITRTVGWFTSQFPVVFHVRNIDDVSLCIREVKETLRRIPNKGIGYGILKYLVPSGKKEGFSFEREPEISFNYLGEMEPEEHDMPFEFSSLDAGYPVDPAFPRHALLEINGRVAKGRLIMDIAFDRAICQGDETGEKESSLSFIHEFKESLGIIIDHCTGKEERELTPFDLTFPGLTLEELDEIKSKIEEINR